MEWYGLTVLIKDHCPEGTIFNITGWWPEDSPVHFDGEVLDIDEDLDYIKNLLLEFTGDFPPDTVIMTWDKTYIIKEYDRNTALESMGESCTIILPYHLQNETYEPEKQAA